MSQQTEQQLLEQFQRAFTLLKAVVVLVCMLSGAVFWIAMMQFHLAAMSNDLDRVKIQLEKLTLETSAARERLIILEQKYK